MAEIGDKEKDLLEEQVVWSSHYVERRLNDRRGQIDRRNVQGRAITIPDMRSGRDRRCGNDRRKRIRLTITGRPIDI